MHARTEIANKNHSNIKIITIMNTDYRYQLETPKLTGRRQKKTTCPACGRGKCFSRYVYPANTDLADLLLHPP